MMRVPSWGNVRFEVPRGIRDGPAAESLHFGSISRQVREWIDGVHFLMKSVLKVSTKSALLASLLSKPSWSVSMT